MARMAEISRIILFSIAFCLVISKIDGESCPPVSVVQPCICTSTQDSEILIECTSNDIQTSYTVIDRLVKKKINVKHFRLGSNTALSLRNQLFNGLELKTIEISMPRLKTINYFSLEDQRYYAETVVIDSSALSQIPIYAILTFSLIKEFQVSNSKNIEVIEANLFSSVPGNHRIRIIKFTSNSIKSIEKNAFADAKHVTEINLRDNKISKIDLKALPGKGHLLQLQNLILWDNFLTSIPTELLENMGKNSTIDLYNNHITDVSSRDLELMVAKHMIVKLGSNSLDCDCSFETLAEAYDQGTKKQVTGQCSTPKDLAGKKLSDLTDDDFLDC